MGVPFTKKQWFIVFTLGSVNLSCGLCVSLQAPFFPKEAEERGSTASEYGLVFAIFELVSIISCPLFGKYIDKIGANKLMNFGIFLAGITSILFGLLDLIHTHAAFISLALVVRSFEALGSSAAITASYSITAGAFQDSIALTFAVLKGMFGVGFMLGPTIGGYLFQLGGFTAPFAALGCFLLLQAVFMPMILDDSNDYNDCKSNRGLPISIFSVLKLKPVFVDLFSIVSASISIGYINVSLEPHIRQFGLTPVLTGMMFMINSGTYALTVSIVGYLCDTRISPKKVIIIGSLSIVVGFTLIGPSPFLPIDTVLWLVCVGLVFHGLGYACILVPTFIDGINSAVACGLPNDMALYGVISGLSQGAFALGDTIGPTVGGLLFDTVGFRKGTLFVIAMQFITVVAMTTVVCTERKPAQKPSSTDAQEREITDQSSLLATTSMNKDYGS